MWSSHNKTHSAVPAERVPGWDGWEYTGEVCERELFDTHLRQIPLAVVDKQHCYARAIVQL